MIEVDNAVLKRLFLEIAAGSGHAFEQFYRQTQQWVLVRLFKHTGCREKAKDATQGFYALMWEKRNRLPEVENPKGFITTCLQRHAINIYRKEKLIPQQKTQLIILTKEEGSNCTQETIAARQLEALIERATNTLPPRQQNIYRLRQYDKHDYQQIGALTGLTPESCYTYHYMALKQIRTLLKEYYN
ncbi:RNA polymerase sigma-70 factor (ECF subfamily) [Filimonas zeae]|uniref:Sigma-70 family RNA polymerase sigma factor n=1 Tax=Filimonas zeae TaxID=1737353 RepID=A0A917IYJ2_9BACT|nr:sigma-70 family RNA polymerase sigma factor [Filimonas zeae]MDR6340138.1 RNA polymerase sigma-70 factor (ECF subfamily) [Filimonas zeae]GGH71322.1 hypothetical protein GCM10011379_30540 [Filimonas zeae]